MKDKKRFGTVSLKDRRRRLENPTEEEIKDDFNSREHYRNLNKNSR